MCILLVLYAHSGLCCSIAAQPFSVPQRQTTFPKGNEFARRTGTLLQREWERQIIHEIVRGNIPEFLRSPVTVRVDTIIRGTHYLLEYYVLPDYLSLGSNEDFLYVPLGAATAQRIADTLGLMLPTKKMAQDIYRSATIKMPARPIPPSATMATMPVFAQHNAMIRLQKDSLGVVSSKPSILLAGHKKDVVISTRLNNSETPDRVAIFGWFRENGLPIQPLSLVHRSDYADYSHGVRLVYPIVTLNGKQRLLRDLLRDSVACELVSDEGVVLNSRYCVPIDSVVLPGFTSSPYFNEQERRYVRQDGLQVLINAPAPAEWQSCKPTNIVLYALPNGNTIEQTIGKYVQSSEDWRYSIQHIGAQTRMLRSLSTSHNVVIVYLMATSKSLPTWRSKTPQSAAIIQGLLDSLLREFYVYQPFITLSGHSGGGAIIFSLLDYWDTIPNEVRRITFLDSNYGYADSSNQISKLFHWLQRSRRNTLSVIAYDDRTITLNGKPVVSATGGTFRRTKEMILSLGRSITLKETTQGDISRYRDPNKQVDIILHNNPANEIYHTVLVEKNGFLHALTTGTGLENKAGEFWGEVLYKPWIQK